MNSAGLSVKFVLLLVAGMYGIVSQAQETIDSKHSNISINYLDQLPDTSLGAGIKMMSTSMNENNIFSDIIFPSPEIEMINKFIDYPVNTQTGLPEVNIPLYEIVCGDLKLPITISYHASGRKTYDRNGPLGLHWILNTGGLVSRTVYGIPDDGYWKFPSPFPKFDTLNVKEDYNLLAGINQSPSVAPYYDTEYDIFSYIYNGGSGNFILKDINNIKVPEVIPNKKIQVKVHKPSPTSNFFDYIEILDEFGVYYRFGKSIISGESNREGAGIATTAWFISEIISANKKDTIHFKSLLTD